MKNDFSRKLIELMPVGYAYLRVLREEDGRHKDYEFMDCNPDFESSAGYMLEEIKGRYLSEILPDVQANILEQVNHARVDPSAGEIKEFEVYSAKRNRYFRARAYSPRLDDVIVFLTDISKEKQEVQEKLAILNVLNDIVFELDEQYIFRNIIVAREANLFLPREMIMGRRIRELFDDEISGQFEAVFVKARESGEKESIEYQLPFENGPRWYKADICFRLIGEQNRFVVSILDISQQKAIQDELNRKTEQLEGFFNISLDLLCIADVDGNFIRLNRAWVDVLGYALDELLGRKFLEFVHPEDVEATMEATARLCEAQSVRFFLNRYRCKDGSYRYIEWCSQSNKNLIYAAARDVTRRIEMERQLKNQKDQFELAIRGSNDGIYDWNLITNELFLSEKWKKQLGYEENELMNSVDSYLDRLHPEERADVMKSLEDYLRSDEKYYERQFRMRCKDGSYRWIRSRGEALRDGDGHAYRMAGSHTDITKQKEAEQEILYLSYHDQLTGLYNRRFYEESLIRLNHQEHMPVTLVMADVNYLKLTNDTYGHLAGDQLLIRFADILKQACRIHDVVARTGGDEFVILLPGTDTESAQRMVERISAALEAAKIRDNDLSVAFGWRTKWSLGESFNEIYTEAENAMYRHKAFLHQQR